MRAKKYSAGILVSLIGPADRRALDSKGILECMIENSSTKRKLKVIIGQVTEQIDPFAEPGFDLRGTPRRAKPYNWKVLEVCLSPDIYKRLIENQYYVSRTRFDRVDITYWEPSK